MKKEFFIENRKKLYNTMEDNSLLIIFQGDAPYKSADEKYPFVPNKNFYYLTGIDRENIILMSMKKNNTMMEFLFIEEEDPILARWIGEKMTVDEGRDISGVENIDYIKNFKGIISEVISRYSVDKIYLDLERQEFKISKTESQNFANELIDKYPYFKINNIYHEITTLRTIKSPMEIEKIRKAIKVTKEGIELMMKKSKSGIKEYELEGYFDYVLTSNGIKDRAFKSIVASGENGTILHYSNNNGVIGENELILLDLGAQYEYYNGDISRTFPCDGKFTDRQKEVYNVVLETNEKIIENAKPGVSFGKLNEIAKQTLAKGCKRLGLIKEDDELLKYYFHSIGHSLGLDAHDVGGRDLVLKVGMVITDEPGLYIPEEKIGIRIEDDLLITEDGCEVLTKDVIKTVEEIEEFMNR